jgi:hypothetical protein
MKKPTIKSCNFCEIEPQLKKAFNLYFYQCPKCFLITPSFKTKVKARGYWNKYRKVLKNAIKSNTGAVQTIY